MKLIVSVILSVFSLAVSADEAALVFQGNVATIVSHHHEKLERPLGCLNPVGLPIQIITGFSCLWDKNNGPWKVDELSYKNRKTVLSVRKLNDNGKFEITLTYFPIKKMGCKGFSKVFLASAGPGILEELVPDGILDKSARNSLWVRKNGVEVYFDERLTDLLATSGPDEASCGYGFDQWGFGSILFRGNTRNLIVH